MSETRTKEFTAITTQEEFDERIKNRLAREREKWEKESGTSDLQAQLAAKDEEIANLKRETSRTQAENAVDQELLRRGITDEATAARIKKLLDLGDTGSEVEPVAQLDALVHEVPELFRVPRGAGSGGSSKPVFQEEKPLTREEVENMSAEEQNRPGMKERIDRFLSGERS
jgi:hypothetical protein